MVEIQRSRGYSNRDSLTIAKIERVKQGKVRRNKITYLRSRSGKAARIKEIL